MISSFTKYIRPIWYFNINYINGKNVPCHFIDYDKLGDSDKKKIVYDRDYSNHNVSKLDAAYQILVKGMNLREKESL